MPTAPRISASGVSADNIIEGSRKRAKLDIDQNSSFAHSPASSTSRLPDITSSNVGSGAEEATALGYKLLDVLINRIDEDDTPIAVPFLALPLRSDYPDYYELIKNPVSLEQIRRRLQNKSFSSFEQVRNALEAICRNAKRYNQKGSEIYEKARVIHQIILHGYADLVEKGEIQPVGDIVLRSDPPLQQQSAQLAKLETPARRARLDYDELDDDIVAGRVSLRLKKDDDIPYDEDDEEEGENREASTREPSSAPPQERKASSMVTRESSNGRTAKVERATPQMEASMDLDDADDGDISSSQIRYNDDVEMVNGRPLDKSMLTLAGKFDRRKRPGPRGKRLKSTLRHLVGELKGVLDQTGEPITRFFETLPSRLQYPDYYKVIQRPIALDSIEEKVRKKEYANPYALVVDLRQMVENAQYYNEEGSEVWEAAEQIRQYVEETTIPTLLADGFTLDPNDMRQSALPVEIAANSAVPAQAAAFRIQMERRAALENGTFTEVMESVSPELPSRSLPMPSDSKLKARLSSRNTTSASPVPLAELQPPIPAPSSAGLGLSGHDTQSMLPRSPYGGALASPGGAVPGAGYPIPPTMSATPSSYLTSGLPHSSPIAGSPWSAPGVNGSHAVHGSNSYFAHLSPGQSPMTGRNASSMAPPSASFTNGSLPFQKPTNVQVQNGSADALSGGDAIPRTSQHLSKRLLGEGPLFDAFKTNVLQVDSETSIVRHAVISHFDVVVQNKISKGSNLAYRLMNDVTRVHSVSIMSGPPEQMNITVEMTPRAIIPREANKEEEKEEEDRQWSISIHHNGKGIKPEWEGKQDDTTMTEIASSITRVQIAAGSPCRFTFAPNPGANIVSIHIHPPPPISALQSIIQQEKHPMRSKAKALLDLPERYRLLVYCRT